MKPREFRTSFIERESGSCQKLCLWLKTVIFAATFLCSTGVAAMKYQDLAELQTQVQQFLYEHYRATEAVEINITVNSLDRRLQLAQCDHPLSMSVNDPAFNGGGQTVHTRCEGVAPWAVYVPAQVSLFRRLPVAQRNLERGNIVQPSDITLEVVNTSLLRQGQLADAENIIGKEVRRPVNKGEPFRVAALDAPLVIKRGDPVTIELQAGAITVNSSGIALANGRIGERIRIKNGQSERTISARVIAAGKVATAI